jgi:hypothetical protein
MDYVTGHWVVPRQGLFKGIAGRVAMVERPPLGEIEGVPLQPEPASFYLVSFNRRPGMPGRPPVAQREKFAPAELRLAKPAEIAAAQLLFPDEARQRAAVLCGALADEGLVPAEQAKAAQAALTAEIDGGAQLNAWQLAQSLRRHLGGEAP